MRNRYYEEFVRNKIKKNKRLFKILNNSDYRRPTIQDDCLSLYKKNCRKYKHAMPEYAPEAIKNEII